MTEPSTPVTHAQKQADITAWKMRQRAFIREENRKYDSSVKEIAEVLAQTTYGDTLHALYPSQQTECWQAARLQFAENRAASE